MGQGLGSGYGTRRPAHWRGRRQERHQPKGPAAVRVGGYPAYCSSDCIGIPRLLRRRALGSRLRPPSTASRLHPGRDQERRGDEARWPCPMPARPRSRAPEGRRVGPPACGVDDDAEGTARRAGAVARFPKRKRRRVPSHRTNQRIEHQEEAMKMSLCPMCANCPEVEMVGDEVRIGEAGNLAVLKKDEWNVLVDLIQTGQLSKL